MAGHVNGSNGHVSVFLTTALVVRARAVSYWLSLSVVNGRVEKHKTARQQVFSHAGRMAELADAQDLKSKRPVFAEVAKSLIIQSFA